MSSTIFKPSNDYKELLILENISKNNNITQRSLSNITDIALSMINDFLNELEKDKKIIINHLNTKVVNYELTKKGIERLRYLSIEYLKASLSIYKEAKFECIRYLDSLSKKGYENIVFYGAGEVAELLIHVIKDNNDLDIKINAIIDDDYKKQKTELLGIDVIGIDQLYAYDYDCILISSYNHSNEIYDNLLNYNINKNNIVKFFE